MTAVLSFIGRASPYVKRMVDVMWGFMTLNPEPDPGGPLLQEPPFYWRYRKVYTRTAPTTGA